MKLLLTLGLVISVQGAAPLVEIANYRSYLDRMAKDFEAEYNKIEAEYESKGCTDAVLLKAGLFAKKIARQCTAVRQNEIYSQNVLLRTVTRMTPLIEKIANDVVKVYISAKKN